MSETGRVFDGNKPLSIVCFILIILVFRIFLGIQINFSQEDYTQVYLIGLENAFSGKWSYWGPDVVWSKTRLPGAMQGLLAGIPLRLVKNEYAPIILSNIISCAGLVLLGFYAKRRFPDLSIYFLLALFLLSPFMLFNGVVLLNTAYLIFSGAILFIVAFELFVYRKELLWNSGLYFFALGFSLLFTYQLHLTWVMYLPFVFVLFYLEWIKNPAKGWKLISFFVLGCIVSGLTLIPTLFKYGNVIMTGSGDNISLNLNRVTRIIDLFIRYFGIATIDVNQKHDYMRLFSEKSWIGFALIWLVKLFAVLQFIGICISFYFVKASGEFRRTFLLFILTLVMALSLYMISNKHLEIRTYILLYPIPLWLTLFSYSYLSKYRHIKAIMYSSLILIFVTSLGIAVSNFNGVYSFKSVESKMQKAIRDENPYEFSTRRETLMDDYD